MAELPRKFSAFDIQTAAQEHLDGYVLLQPSTPGAELVRVKVSELIALYLQLNPPV